MAKKATKAPKDKKAEQDKRRVELADLIAADRDCDILLYNFGLDIGVDQLFRTFFRQRKTRRPNLLVFVTTEGGDPDTAYRIARHLQAGYKHITAVVCGWCKSGGTLICIGADDLIVCDDGELGPLDIQIAKADEWEAGSGLAIEAAFEKLQEESFKLFIRNLQDIRDESGSRITFRTASEIASQMVVGVTRDIFAKIDPLSVGEDHRSNLVAEQYAKRLNLRAKNLKPGTDYDMGGLRMLLRGYPSHSFVIDREEAGNLFRRVTAPTGNLAELIQLLGMDMIFPRHSRRNQSPRWEFLNHEKRIRTKAATTPKGGRRPRAPAARPRAKVVSGHLPPSPQQDSGRKDAA